MNWSPAIAVLFLPLLVSCGGELNYPDCEEVAMRSADGSIDDCDLQACEAAFSEGCVDCFVFTIRPPIYSADDVAFDVYDVCPDWSAD